MKGVIMKQISLWVFAILLYIGNSYALENKNKFSGYMFGDYYGVISNHDSTINGSNGFRFRRIYFTFDRDLSSDFSVRLRFEMNSRGNFTSNTKFLALYVKDAYLKWSYGKHKIYAGISPTPTWDLIEKVWGYRSVEKTPLDLQKYGSSRAFGIAFKGSFDDNKRYGYHLMLANRSSIPNETNKGFKTYLSIFGKITKNIVVEAYGDFEDRPGHADIYTLQGFAAYQIKNFKFGIQYAYQDRQFFQTSDKTILRVASIFSTGKIVDKFHWYARIDRLFDPNPIGDDLAYLTFDSSAKAYFFLAGVDFRPIENVHLMPNVEINYYDKVNDVRPESDIVPRITVFYVWR
jgi:hypothetical protein